MPANGQDAEGPLTGDLFEGVAQISRGSAYQSARGECGRHEAVNRSRIRVLVSPVAGITVA